MKTLLLFTTVFKFAKPATVRVAVPTEVPVRARAAAVSPSAAVALATWVASLN